MKKLIVLAMGCLMLSGCALGAAASATSGYSLQAKSSDELGQNARQSIIIEAVKQANAYTDSKIK